MKKVGGLIRTALAVVGSLFLCLIVGSVVLAAVYSKDTEDY